MDKSVDRTKHENIFVCFSAQAQVLARTHGDTQTLTGLLTLTNVRKRREKAHTCTHLHTHTHTLVQLEIHSHKDIVTH